MFGCCLLVWTFYNLVVLLFGRLVVLFPVSWLFDWLDAWIYGWVVVWFCFGLPCCLVAYLFVRMLNFLVVWSICCLLDYFLPKKFVYLYIYIYVSYSWPNGWTNLAEIFWGNPLVGTLGVTKALIKILIFKIRFLSTGTSASIWYFETFVYIWQM